MMFSQLTLIAASENPLDGPFVNKYFFFFSFFIIRSLHLTLVSSYDNGIYSIYKVLYNRATYLELTSYCVW